MKLIEANKNPFFTVLSIIETCRDRAAFQEDELQIVGEVFATMQFLGQMLESDVEGECGSDCDCELALPACDGSCQPETDSLPQRFDEAEQLELPLEQPPA